MGGLHGRAKRRVMSETASIARPQLGNVSPVIPAHIRKLSEEISEGKLTVREAQRRLGQARGTQAKTAVGSDRKAAALAGAKARLEKHAKDR